MYTPTRIVTTALVLLVLASGVIPAGSTPSEATTTNAHPATGTQLDPDSVLMRIDLHADGSSTWYVTYRMRLDDQNTTAAFESIHSDIEANQSQFIQRFATRMRRTIAHAENSTGREMALQNVTIEATRRQLPQAYGVVTYTFTWTGFAVHEDTSLRVGDAITGLFLDEETRLLISWPVEYRVVDVAPPPDEQRDHAVVWTGPIDFANGEPRIVLSLTPASSRTSSSSSADGAGPTAQATAENARAGGSGGRTPAPSTLAALGVTVIGLVFVGVIGWYVSRRTDDGTSDAPASDASTELLSNEERVLALLEKHDGRIKQQEVATELDWTEAKTSQVIRDLRDADEIDTFRLGRENVLTLPDTDAVEFDTRD